MSRVTRDYEGVETPIGALTPAYVGETIKCSDVLWEAQGISSSDWNRVVVTHNKED